MNCEHIVNTPTLQSRQKQGNIAITDQLKDRFILFQAVREHARPSLKNRRYLAEREERETSVWAPTGEGFRTLVLRSALG